MKQAKRSVDMNSSFHKKLFASISLIMLILTSVCVIAFSFYTYNNMKRQSIENLNQLTLRTSTELQTLFDDMDKVSLYISTNPNIMQAFYDAKKKNYSDTILSTQIMKIITSISTPNSSSRYRISLYNENKNFLSTGIPYNKNVVAEKLNSPNYLEWYQSLPIIPNDSNLSVFQSDYWSQSKMPYLSLYRNIFGRYLINDPVGIIDIQCPYSLIEQILSFNGGDYQCYLFDTEQSTIFPMGDDFQLPSTLQDNGSFHTLLYSGIPMENGWTLLLTQSQSHIFQVLLPQILIIVFIGLSTLFITLLMLFIITKRTTQPLRDLTASVKRVSLSNLSLAADAPDYPDEVSSLNQAFDKMFQHLKESMDENVKIKSYEMQANMVALQSQMDPHFLFNILTIIKALSHENNTKQISITCDYLVKMLRYISNYNEGTASLSQELEHTEYYLQLMKIRYEDQFTYTFHIDSDVDTQALYLPKLSLQPLVENCFQHGFQKTAPPWEIFIHCWTNESNWFLNVQDNGFGITEADLEALNQKIDSFLSNPSDSLTSLKIGGMGLVNTVARLKLKYKDHIIFKIENLPLGGTSITLGGVLDYEYFISGR